MLFIDFYRFARRFDSSVLIMAVAHSQQLRLWDPQALFKMANPDKFNDVTCVGWAFTRDRRCKRHIGKDRRNAAEYLMNRLAYIEPRQVIELEITRLGEIAYYCLCTTHREGSCGQWDSIVSDWVASLEEEQTRLESRQARRDLNPDPELEAESTPPPPIALHCLQHHTSRRSIDEDCPICTMTMVNCRLSELVWCKQQCGRSVHKDCFEQMLVFASNSMRCVYWSVSRPPETLCKFMLLTISK